jgi:sigma-B regulation protein RsbU (phosphoserine phosphatase)
MTKPSDERKKWREQREKIIGLGERSLRKTYYPALQQKLDELERFRALLDQSNDCIFLIKVPSLAFVDVNESACRQLGCPRQTFLSRPLEKFLPHEAATRIRELVAFGHAEGKDQDTITTHLYKCSGEVLPVEIVVRLVAFNKDIYGVAVARDITERKRAEKILLENSMMLRDMELARQIQLSLLPTAPPEIPGIRLAGCCVPAAHVGGDYYDYYRRGKGILDMVVADVSGHSIGAALMTAEARSVLRAQVHVCGGTGDMLASLNNLLYEDLEQAELFITLFYVKYDTRSRLLTYSNAGHVSPLLFRPSDTFCRELDAEGLILGVRKDIAFEEKQLLLQEQDVLLLYTDGITEAQNAAGEMFGFGRLCAILHAEHSKSPQAIIEMVLREISAFTGTTALEDDVTMIVMKVTGQVSQ